MVKVIACLMLLCSIAFPRIVMPKHPAAVQLDTMFSMCSGFWLDGLVYTAGHCLSTPWLSFIGDNVVTPIDFKLSDAEDWGVVECKECLPERGLSKVNYTPANIPQLGAILTRYGVLPAVIMSIEGDDIIVFADVIPGDSGSALLDSEGRVIGIVVARFWEGTIALAKAINQVKIHHPLP